MKNLFKLTLIAAFAFVSLNSCKDDVEDPKPTNTVSKKEVIKNYANIVHTSYEDSYKSAKAMQAKINEFLSAPSAEKFEAAKKSWLAARDIYGLTEVYRACDGPIDAGDALNTEGQINAWPLNEAYIDYVNIQEDAETGSFDNSLISGTEAITSDFIKGKNEDGGDKNVSTGWHAIEFLLWGQDDTKPSENKPGRRAFTDYTTKENKERRAQYLKVTTELLVADLKDLSDIWAPNGDYAKVFLALDENTALTNMLNGTYFLAASELSEERMDAPVNNEEGLMGGKGQEDEHSCFSDNTHRDVWTNAKGIVNVLEGKYNSIEGASFMDLLKEKDDAQAKKLQSSMNDMMKAIDAIDKEAAKRNFDVMIMDPDGNNIVLKGSDALKALGDVIKESAAKLNITTVIPVD